MDPNPEAVTRYQGGEVIVSIGIAAVTVATWLLWRTPPSVLELLGVVTMGLFVGALAFAVVAAFKRSRHRNHRARVEPLSLAVGILVAFGVLAGAALTVWLHVPRPVTGIIFLLALAIGGPVYERARRTRRETAMRGLTQDLRLRYDPTVRDGLGADEKQLAPFITLSELGAARIWTEDFFQGTTDGVAVEGYVLVGQTGRGKLRLSVVVGRPAVSLPDVTIAPEELGEKIAEQFGRKDVDPKDDASWAGRWWVRSPTPAEAEGVLGYEPRSIVDEPGWHTWHMRGTFVCSWTEGRAHVAQWTPEIKRMARMCRALQGVGFRTPGPMPSAT